jgi:hypothetical protein
MSFHTNKSTRHASSDRRIAGRLKAHKALMEKYEAEGMTREAASARALDELTKEETLIAGTRGPVEISVRSWK